MKLFKRHIQCLLLLICMISTTSLIASESSELESLSKHSDGYYSNINNEQLKKLVAEDVLVVDIRREEEWKQTGIVPGSKTITFFDKYGRIDPNFLPKFTAITKKEQPLILICRTGARTKVASQAIAQQLGYKHVINVTEGIMGWIAEKRPVSEYKQ